MAAVVPLTGSVHSSSRACETGTFSPSGQNSIVEPAGKIDGVFCSHRRVLLYAVSSHVRELARNSLSRKARMVRSG
jgi:hypothetical protein